MYCKMICLSLYIRVVFDENHQGFSTQYISLVFLTVLHAMKLFGLKKKEKLCEPYRTYKVSEI